MINLFNFCHYATKVYGNEKLSFRGRVKGKLQRVLTSKVFKDLFPFTSHIMKTPPRGVALLMVLFFFMFMTFLAISVSYETIVEYRVASQQVSRLKAYYAAKSGVEISLLRLLVYKKALAAVGNQIDKSLLEPIWSFPLAWPPSAFLPDGLDLVNQRLIKDAEKESSMDSSYVTDISLEGALIDINDLGSSSKALQEATKKQLFNIFNMEVQNNEEFADKYEDFDFEKLINNMVDWMDADNQSLNGGSEKNEYYDIEEIDFTSFNNDFLPPNTPFKTLDELHMVATMEDNFFELLQNRITIFGNKGIQVNHTSQEVLLSLDPEMTPEIVTQILARREDPLAGGPFKDEDDFVNFIANADGSEIDPEDFNKRAIPLLFDDIFNFRVTSTGQFAQSTREIVAIVYDFEATKERLITLLEKEDKKDKNEDQSSPPSAGGKSAGGKSAGGKSAGGKDAGGKPGKSSTPSSSPPPGGRPHIVYWEER